jgi:hypothetical protein
MSSSGIRSAARAAALGPQLRPVGVGQRAVVAVVAELGSCPAARRRASISSGVENDSYAEPGLEQPRAMSA